MRFIGLFNHARGHKRVAPAVSNDKNNSIHGNLLHPHTCYDFPGIPTYCPLTCDFSNAMSNIPMQPLAGPSQLPCLQQLSMRHHTYHPDYGPYAFNVGMHPNPLLFHSNVPYNSPPVHIILQPIQLIILMKIDSIIHYNQDVYIIIHKLSQY